MDDSMAAFLSMRQYFGLESRAILDTVAIRSPVFVAVDTGFDNKGITQLGISTFDTNALENPDISCSISNEYPVSTILYATKVSKYKERRRKPSHFGERQVLHLGELRQILKGALAPTDVAGHQRDVVLVGHMISSDVLVIKRSCGLDITSLATVKAIIDTQHISHQMMKSSHPLSLKYLLLALRLNYVGLHNAAHDSRYTLRALLAMFCRYQQLPSKIISQSAAELIHLVEEIAIFHQNRKPILWCPNSTRPKLGGNGDIMDQDYGEEFGCHEVLKDLFCTGSDCDTMTPWNNSSPTETRILTAAASCEGRI